jgi:hypothetical protein
MTGVSTDIGTSFVRPSGRIGDTLIAKAILVGMGEFGHCAWLKVFTMPARQIARIYSCWVLQPYRWFSGIWTYGSYHTQPVKFWRTITDHTKYIGKSSAHEVRRLSDDQSINVELVIRTIWSSQRTDKRRSRGKTLNRNFSACLFLSDLAEQDIPSPKLWFEKTNRGWFPYLFSTKDEVRLSQPTDCKPAAQFIP